MSATTDYDNLNNVPSQTAGISPLDADDWNTYVRDNFDALKFGHLVCTVASRPTGVADGVMIFETDSNAVMVRSDGAWVPADVMVCANVGDFSGFDSSHAGLLAYERDNARFVLWNGAAWVAAVGTDDLAALAVTTAKIDDLAVTEGKIADSAVTSVKIANNTIVDADVNSAAAIAKTKIAGTAVTLTDSKTVATSMIADNAITTAQILDGTILADDLASNSVTADKIASAAVTYAKQGIVPSCKASKSTSTSISTNVVTSVALNTEAWDTGAATGGTEFHSVTTNTTRITPSVPGIYAVSGFISWDSPSSSGMRGIIVYQNGTSSIANTYAPATSGIDMYQAASGQAYFNGTTDYVELRVYQNSGAALTLNSGPTLAVTRLGPIA